MSHLPGLRSRLSKVSHQPGVYLMMDRLGSIIYVGKAKDLRRRLSSYFMPSGKKRADRKTRALIDSICDFETHEVRNEQEALLLEGKLIKQYRPRYNVSFMDDKRFQGDRCLVESGVWGAELSSPDSGRTGLQALQCRYYSKLQCSMYRQDHAGELP
jgi:hypothetical protein